MKESMSLNNALVISNILLRKTLRKRRLNIVFLRSRPFVCFFLSDHYIDYYKLKMKRSPRLIKLRGNDLSIIKNGSLKV